MPVKAAKTDWLPNDRSFEFTPFDGSLRAKAACESAVSRQARDGYIIEYISKSIEKPNPPFDTEPDYLEELQVHERCKGQLLAVHRIQHSSRSQRAIIGDAAFEKLQDKWARDGKRYRFSVAFPIVESFDIEDPPQAESVLGQVTYRRLFAHPGGLLRAFTEEDRAKLAELRLIPREAINLWIAIENDAQIAARKPISKKLQQDIDRDLALVSAMEGLTVEQKTKVRLRAAGLAYDFVKARERAGKLTCDDCNFDPTLRVSNTGVRPRSLLDVHHRQPLAEGKRLTQATGGFFQLLCPTCHRLTHALMRLSSAEG